MRRWSHIRRRDVRNEKIWRRMEVTLFNVDNRALKWYGIFYECQKINGKKTNAVVFVDKKEKRLNLKSFY